MTSDHNPIDTTRTVTLSCGHLGNPLNIDGIKGLGICHDGCGTQGIRSRNIPAWEPRTGSYTQDTNGNICVRETEKCAPVISAKGAVWAEWRCGCRVYGNITKTKMKQCGGTNQRDRDKLNTVHENAVATLEAVLVILVTVVAVLFAGFMFATRGVHAALAPLGAAAIWGTVSWLTLSQLMAPRR